MRIPLHIIDKNVRMHGEKAIIFFERLCGRLDDVLKDWQIRDVMPLPTQTANVLITGKTESHGDVVVKAGMPDTRFFYEIAMLKRYRGKRMCALYEVILEDGIQLLERIVPGTTLREAEPEVMSRHARFADCFASFHLPADDADRFPTHKGLYEQFVNQIFWETPWNGLRPFVEQGFLVYEDLERRYARRCLLHGDLHCENMLIQDNHEVRAIDPHGLLGDPIFDTARYLINELPPPCDASAPDGFSTAVRTLGKLLRYPEKDLLACVFLDAIQHACWHLTGAMTQERLTRDTARCALTHRLYQEAN